MKPMLTTVLAYALTALAVGTAHAAEHTMRISHQFPPTHQTSKNLEQFAKDVAAESNGKVEVQLFGAAQLFKPNQHHAAVAGNQIEAAIVLNFQWGGTIPEMNVTSIPFLMTSAEKIRKFPSSPAAALLEEKMQAKGVKNIAWIVDANDAIFTSAKAPLVAPKDFEGIKIRGLSKVFDAGLIAMGAAPSAMPGSEVYQALQSGVIDATITGVEAAHSRRMYEVQKYGAASPLLLAYDNLIVSPKWWNELPADARKAIESAAKQAEQRSLPETDDIPPQMIQQLRDEGMQVTVLDAAQQKALRDVMQPAVIEAFKAGAPDGAKLIDLIEKM